MNPAPPVTSARQDSEWFISTLHATIHPDYA